MSALGIVAAGSEESARAGESALRSGGNAVDAVVAAAFATAAGDASITSLAGGGVLAYRDARRGGTEVCDFFVNGPGLGASEDGGGPGGEALDFHSVEIRFGVGGAVQTFHVGRGSAAVPGVVPGLAASLERWGRLDLAEVVAPTVRWLREGVEVTPYQADCFRILEPILRLSPQGREVFCRRDGDLLRAGDQIRNPPLAGTLEDLGRRGVDSVWGRDLAAEIIEGFGPRSGGRITAEDLAEYRPEFRPALSSAYAGARVETHAPPSLGGRFILLTLELFASAEAARPASDAAERYRRVAAIFRAISEARAEDPHLADRADAGGRLERRLDAILARPPAEGGASEPTGPGSTSHISAVDREGNAAGVTISHGEGCGHWIGSSGLHMNNVLGEEDLFPGGFHEFAPGRRLATMMAPTILEEPDGTITSLGSGGSNRIRTAMAQVISGLLDDRLPVARAVDRGRLHFEGGVLSAEGYALPGGEDALRSARALARELQLFDEPSLFFGGVHVARRRPDGTFEGAGDPRRSGIVRLAR